MVFWVKIRAAGGGSRCALLGPIGLCGAIGRAQTVCLLDACVEIGVCIHFSYIVSYMSSYMFVYVFVYFCIGVCLYFRILFHICPRIFVYMFPYMFV